jgi:hypothetical protein
MLLQGGRWHLPVVDSPISTSVWLQSRRILAVGFANGKVILAGISRASSRGVVNHADIKDQASIIMTHVLDSGSSSPVAAIRFNASAETIMLCMRGVEATEFNVASGAFIRAFIPELQVGHYALKPKTPYKNSSIVLPLIPWQLHHCDYVRTSANNECVLVCAGNSLSLLLRPERVSEIMVGAGGGSSSGQHGPNAVSAVSDAPVVTITVGVNDEEEEDKGGHGGEVLDSALQRDIISDKANLIIQDHLEAQPGGHAKLPPAREDTFVHQEIPKLSSKFLRPVKYRAGGGGGFEGERASMFVKTLKIANQVVEEVEQQDVRPSTSDRHIAAATPQSQFGGNIDNDRLKLLEETVRSRIIGASSLATLHTSHTATASAASAATLTLDDPSNSPFDAADEMIMKLHLSKSSNSRAKTLRDLSGRFFPKALEVTCARSCYNQRLFCEIIQLLNNNS